MHHERKSHRRRWLALILSGVAAAASVVGVALPASAATSPTVTNVTGGCTTAGGQPLTVTGTFLLGASNATVGGVPAVVSSSSATAATVTCPPEPIGGIYNLVITVPGGSPSPYTNAYPIPYQSAGGPTVTKLAPSAGTTSGGTSVTITGTGFVAPVVVRFGAATAQCSAPASANSIVCTSPPSATEGPVDVLVSTNNGVSWYVPADTFTYSTGPSIASITPNSAPASGSPNTSVVITGANLADATSVSFGTLQLTANDFTTSATQINILLTGSHPADVVDVTVTTPEGKATAADIFRFIGTAAPQLTSVSPTTGAAGDTITFTGSGFAAMTSVTFANIPAPSVQLTSDTSLTATVPVGVVAGVVNVAVVTSNGTATLANAFTVNAVNGPTITTISPKTGGPGTSVTILGTGFANVTAANGVTFGGINATYTVNSDTSITASAPYGMPAGDIDVVVTNPSGASAKTANTKFTNTAGANQTLVLQGRFSLIAWVGADGMTVGNALAGGPAGPQGGTNNIASQVAAVWSFNSATRTWSGYFPASANIPGANDLTTLKFGGGYFVSLVNPASGPVNWVVARA